MLNIGSDAGVVVGDRRRRNRRLRFRLLGLERAVRALDGARLILLLHVDAAAEMRAVGDGDARRDDVALDRAVLLDVDLLGRVQIPRHLAEDDDGLGGDLGLDATVRSDSEHVVAQLDLAVDPTLDREVLAAAQLAVDHNALSDARQLFVHGPRLLLGLSLRRRLRLRLIQIDATRLYW